MTDIDGNVWAWEHNGKRRAGFAETDVDGRRMSQVHVDPVSLDDPATGKDQFNRTKRGIASEPAAGDLDGDGHLEIVVAALDRHVYAWHDDGTTVAGFPVLLVDPAKVGVRRAGHAVRHLQADAGAREGGELLATPALGDLTGDGRPEIVVGAQEEYAEPINVGSGADVLALLGPPARSATGASTRSRPRAPTRRTRARHLCIPTSRPTSRDGRSRSECCNSSRCRPSATACRPRP